MFLETSALTGENVEEAFIMAARTILGRIDEGTVAGMANVWMTILSRHVSVWFANYFIDCELQFSTGQLDPTRVGSGVQLGERRTAPSIQERARKCC
jgi:hypothetical protein